jgi:hypothetical protein
MTKGKEVIKAESVKMVPLSPQAMIGEAIANGADLVQLEKLLDIQIKYEENEAKKAYFSAMTEFKKNPPQINKNVDVKYGNTQYSHADLAEVTNKINCALSEHGLSASWETEQTDKTVSVTCKITHEQGFSQKTTLTSAPDNSGSKNQIQAIGSAITYLQRYTLLALTGLATKGQDNDGQGEPPEFIDDKQKSQIVDMINAKEVPLDKFLGYMAVEDVEFILKKDFGKAMNALKLAKGQKGDDK